MERIVIEINLDDGDVIININNMELVSTLKGNGWNKLTGEVKVNSVQLIMDIENINNKVEKKEIPILLEKIRKLETIDDLREMCRNELELIPMYINVYHDREWEIYNDYNFEGDVSVYFNMSMWFTEQGMQQNLIASMEN